MVSDSISSYHYEIWRMCMIKDSVFCYAKITVKNNIQFSCIGRSQGIGFIINYRIGRLSIQNQLSLGLEKIPYKFFCK